MDELGQMAPSVPGYEVVGLLGAGGFGSVYEANQLSVGRPVALKILSPGGVSADLERRFRSECRTVGALSWHPNIVSLYDAGVAPNGAPFLAMELIPGGSLGDRLERGAVAPAEVASIGAQVATALAAAHDAGVLHRDVKPDNLLVGRLGEVQLADFGVATLVDGTRSATGTFSGTLAFAAPETLRGDPTSPLSDVYALGATLYALLAGSPAFVGGSEASPAAIVWRVGSEDPAPLPSHVPPRLAAVVARAMSKDPTARPQSAAELASELTAAHEDTLDESTVLFFPPSRSPQAATAENSGPLVSAADIEAWRAYEEQQAAAREAHERWLRHVHEEAHRAWRHEQELAAQGNQLNCGTCGYAHPYYVYARQLWGRPTCHLIESIGCRQCHLIVPLHRAERTRAFLACPRCDHAFARVSREVLSVVHHRRREAAALIALPTRPVTGQFLTTDGPIPDHTARAEVPEEPSVSVLRRADSPGADSSPNDSH